MSQSSKQKNIYSIDRNDRLVSVGGGWDGFAMMNDSPELVGDNVISISIWNFISGEMLRHVYFQILLLVRAGKSLRFDLRCDSPETRRFLEMRITPALNGGVQFETVITLEEDRAPEEILRTSLEGDGEIIVSCSWCNKINTGEDVWHEVEDAIKILKLLELDSVPQLSHGMCSYCFETAMNELAAR